MHARVRRALAVLGSSLTALLLVPVAAGAAGETTPPDGVFDGDPSTTERVDVGQPTFAAVEISQRRFGADRRARLVVLSRDDSFADSVAGSALTTDGPLLLTRRDRLSPVTRREIARVLPDGGRVVLLGGTAAISDAVAEQLGADGFDVSRLAGRSRIETAITVADEVRARAGGDEVLLARAYGTRADETASWADSVAAGALAAERRIPVLITTSDQLDPAVAAWLRQDAPATTTLVGGTAALSPAVEEAVPGPRRVSGVDRTATAAAVATRLWAAPTSGDREFVVTNGATGDGWAFGFAAAGLAADADAPVLLVTSAVTDATSRLVRTCGTPEVELALVGDGAVVPAALREQLDAADGLACGAAGSIVYPTDLDPFPACSPLLAYFQQAALERVGPYGFGGPVRAIAVPGGDDGAEAAPVADGDAGGGGSSGTNVQEEGVDEPDIVKTDGHHAFVATTHGIQIVRVDRGAPEHAASLSLPDGSHELLLSGTRLLVVSRSHTWIADGRMEAQDVVVDGGHAQTTLTYVDVADPAAPRIDSSLVIEGDYRSARMVGTTARIVIQGEPADLGFTHPSEPGEEAEHAAASHNRAVIEQSTLDDWLPAYQRRDAAGNEVGDAALLDCATVHQPPMFSGLGTLSVVTLDLAGDVQPTSTAAVVASGETVYASTARLFVTTGRWDWEPTGLGAGVTTEVHGFDIADPGATRYVGSGSVPGYVLNQFSLSEHEGHLRIATTTEPPWWDGAPGETESGVHVLAEQGGSLVTVGKVTGLGRGERIFAVRYFGSVAAVVTFRQIDPLYLLDLSDPASPRVTGELKIPGVSSYLHRVTDDRLLGVGWEATEDGRITGVQVSLFDIGDVAAPALLDKLVFDRSMTAVSWDHHAFLHWPATGLAVVPLVTEGADRPAFIGSVGLRVTRDAVDEVGRATHTDDAGADAWPEITRSFVANGVLFTVSHAGIEAAHLDTMTERAWLAFR